jgi:flagellar basal-body rod modification protein FlgD
MTPPVNSTTTTDPTTSGTSGTLSTSGTTLGTGAILGPDDFLKLMMVQLEHQDPLQPTDPTEYLSQLAQFTTVEQMTNVAQSTAQAAAEQHTATALAMIGHKVTYTDSNGNKVTGTVQSVQFTSSGPSLTVDGVAGVDPSSVDEVS